MLFNTLSFAIFFPIVFLLYWFLPGNKLKLQNVLLFVSSYFFYACWDWRFLFLLAFSTFLDYFTGLKMAESSDERSRKAWFWLSIFVNLGFLGVFKYYNFFVASFEALLACIGLRVNPLTLDIILPVGISFYTFHGLSYVIDIYHNRIKAEKDFMVYAVFVSFFPLLVAGPIERATHFLPQIKKKRIFVYDQATDGLRQIVWGLFKKIVIADQCARYVSMIFDHAEDYSGSTLVLGAVLFAFQIYCDFSGYSDIALGTARLLGFDLLRNFSFPYFSRDIAEFWRRWHISLSSWFRDYVYIPLGGSKGGRWITLRNTFIVFVVSGLWHGANWTFIIWGLLHALYMVPLIVSGASRNNLDIAASGKQLPSLKEMLAILFTFILTTFAWIFFRSADLTQALNYISGIFAASLFSVPSIIPRALCFFIPVFMLIEWHGRERQHALAGLGISWRKPIRWGFYYVLMLLIFYFSGIEQQFIYFQF